jgi:beta-N-acetylhexosaminidase
MSDLHRLAHRVLMASFAGPVAPEWLADRLGAGLGSVCLFGSNLTGRDADVAALTAALHAAGPGCLVALDEEGGDVTRLDALAGSPVPGAAALGAVDDTGTTRAVAAGLGARLAAVGIDLDLAPDADVNSAPDNPVIGVRSFGSSPALVARHVRAYVAGLQSAGVAACAKHFPGHGDTRQDSHVDLPTVTADAGLLAGRELVPFVAAVRAGVAAIMTSHVLLPALDPRHPATTSPAVLGMLRRDLGFDGVIVSDALDMAGVSGPKAYGSIPAAAVASLAAGADLLCIGPDIDDELVGAVVAAIRDAVAAGSLPADRLADAAARVDALAVRVAAGTLAGPGPAAATGPGRPRTGPQWTGDDGDWSGIGRQVAARALRVDGAVPDLAGALAVTVHTAPLIAAGAVPWGVGPALSRRLPGVVTVDLREADAGSTVPARPDQPVVAAVRDAHRHPWVWRWLERTAAEHPLTVVEMGWPADVPLPGDCRVWTYGASRVAGEAAADLLAGGRAGGGGAGGGGAGGGR